MYIGISSAPVLVELHTHALKFPRDSVYTVYVEMFAGIYFAKSRKSWLREIFTVLIIVTAQRASFSDFSDQIFTGFIFVNAD